MTDTQREPKGSDMHKDLSDKAREHTILSAVARANVLHNTGQSLALAREAWIKAFDAAAEKLDALECRAQADRDHYDKRAGEFEK